MRTALTVACLLWLGLAGPAMGAAIYVDMANTSGTETGSQTYPFNTIQEGINAAADGDTVWLADGTYTGTGNTQLSWSGKSLTVTSVNGVEATAVDGGGSTPVFSFASDVSGNIGGITIQNASTGVNFDRSINVSMAIESCIVTGCSTAIMRNNYTSGTLTITNCVIVDNGTNPQPHRSGGLDIMSGTNSVTNTTLANNNANLGGGLYAEYCSVTLTNSIVWGNTSSQMFIYTGGSATFSYCDFQGGQSGTGNIDADPLFLDAGSGNYQLSSASPCRNTGTLSGAPNADILGNPRPYDIDVDMGAYEYTPDTLPSLVLAGSLGQATLAIDGTLQLKSVEVGLTYNTSAASYSGASNLHPDFQVTSITDNSGVLTVDGSFSTMPTEEDYTILTLTFAPAGGGSVNLAFSSSHLSKQVGGDEVSYIKDTDYQWATSGAVTFESAPPTITSVEITSTDGGRTAPTLTDYVKDGDAVTVSAAGTDQPNDSTAAGVDQNGVTADLQALGGGASVTPGAFSYDSGTRTWTASWALSNVTCTPSDAPLTVTVSATDKAGNTATPGTDTIVADNTPPTVSNVTCAKSNVPTYPANLDAASVKNGDTVCIYADIADNGSGIDSSSADASQLGGSSSLAATGGTVAEPIWCFSVNGAIEEAQKTVSVAASDVVGNAATAVTDTINLDNVLPTAVAGFSAYPSNALDNTAPCDLVKLAWTTAGTDGNLAGHVIRRNAWGGTGYPEYASGDAPGYPGASEGTLVSDGSLTSPLKDDANDGLSASERNIYTYQMFAYDKAGNFSTAATSQQACSTNYQLGDFHDEGIGTFSGAVDFTDLGDFSNAFHTSSGEGNWNAACDIGPTAGDSRKGIPVPDDTIDFEDLMIFAMNYAQPLAAPLYEPTEFPVDMPSVVLERESTQPIGSGETFHVALRLSPELRAKGAHVTLHFDPRFFAPIDVRQG